MGYTGWSDKLNGRTSTPLAAVVFKGKLHVFSTGVEDKKIYVKSSADGTNWGEWDFFEGTTDVAVTPVVFNDVLHVFGKGLDDDKVYVRMKAKIGSWTNWEEFGGTTNAALGAAVFRGLLFVFAKGLSDNNVYFRSKALVGGWTPWEPFGGTTDVPVMPVAFQNRLYVFSKGMDDDKIYQRSRGGSGGWNSWQEVGGTTQTAITSVVYGGDLHLFAPGHADKRLYSVIVGRGNNWSPWFPVSPVSATTNTWVAPANFMNKLHLFSCGIDDKKIYTQNMAVYRLPFDDDNLWQTSGNWDSVGHGPGEQAFDYDFGHPEGGNIRAARGGRVLFVENNSVNTTNGASGPGYGTAIHIKHDDGSTAAYIHLKFNSTLVEKDDRVTRGQIIALSGNTGHSFGPHLHFGIHSSADNNAGTGQHLPVYFRDKNHQIPWRPAAGDELASDNS